MDSVNGKTGVCGFNTSVAHTPFVYGYCLFVKVNNNTSFQYALNVSDGHPLATRVGTGPWVVYDGVS